MRFAPSRLRRPVALAAVAATASAVTGLFPGTADAAPRVVRLTATSSPAPTPSPSPTATPSVIVSPSEIVVPEGGWSVIFVRLSERPSYGWVTVDSERLSGDADLSIGPRLLFPADQWYVWQPLTVFAEEDDDTTDGTGTFLSRISQLPGSGTAVWTVRELDNDIATPSPAPSPS